MKTKIERASPKSADGPFPPTSSPAVETKGLAGKVLNGYVAWIDLMGAKATMGRALSAAAGHIARIHVAALTSADADIRVYPVIDGCYAITSRRAALESFLTNTMTRLASAFVNESKCDRKFLVRGGIAAGRILHGDDLASCSPALQQQQAYARCLAIGTPIGQAYSAERLAPPYGFWVDITARSFVSTTESPREHPFVTTYWPWWKGRPSADKLGSSLDEYFTYARDNHRALEYPLDRLEEHCAAAREYFRPTRAKCSRASLTEETAKKPA